MNEVKPWFPLPGEEATLGERLILNALRRKLDALRAYEENPTPKTQKAFLEAVDHMNRIKESV
jgi:translation elongation factor EF-Tu-like GTPase